MNLPSIDSGMMESQDGERQWRLRANSAGQRQLNVRTVVCELLRQVGELRRRIEVLEGRGPVGRPLSACPGEPWHADDESPPYGVETSAPDPPTPDEDGSDDEVQPATEGDGVALRSLPHGPIKIDLAAKALGKGVRTLRGWCQDGRYDIPCHREGGRWHFFRDELEAWQPEYREKSRRDAKRAQAKRRRTKNGKQCL